MEFVIEDIQTQQIKQKKELSNGDLKTGYNNEKNWSITINCLGKNRNK